MLLRSIACKNVSIVLGQMGSETLIFMRTWQQKQTKLMEKQGKLNLRLEKQETERVTGSSIHTGEAIFVFHWINTICSLGSGFSACPQGLLAENNNVLWSNCLDWDTQKNPGHLRHAYILQPRTHLQSQYTHLVAIRCWFYKRDYGNAFHGRTLHDLDFIFVSSITKSGKQTGFF